MKVFYLLIFSLSLFFGNSVEAQVPTYADVDYVGDGHPRHTLDVYIPPGTSALAKTVVYFHGGWWLSGSKGRTMGFCHEFYDAGYVVVGVNYRLSSDSIFPAQIYDCKTAIRYIKTYSDIFRIDTCNIGVMGESAGGHLSALLGTSIGVPDLEGLHLGSTSASSDVHAVVDYFGPTSFNEMDGNAPSSCSSSIVHDNEYSGESLLIGCRISTCPDLVKRADPISYINGNEPPISIHHGDSDCLIPPNQSILLHNALELLGLDTELNIYEGGGHGDFIDAGVRKYVLNYFNSRLVNECSNATGLDEHTFAEEQIKVFPNPGSGKYFIAGHQDKSKIRIYSLNGQFLQEKAITDNSFDISNLTRGTYIVEVIPSMERMLISKQ